MEVKWRAMICPSWQSKSKMISQSEPRRWPIEVYINQQIRERERERGRDRERDTHIEIHRERKKGEGEAASTYCLLHPRELVRSQLAD
jgi:hypothetical protein